MTAPTNIGIMTVLMGPPEMKLLMPKPVKSIPVAEDSSFAHRGSFVPVTPCTVFGILLLGGCRSRDASEIFKSFFIYVDAELCLKFLKFVLQILSL